VAKIIFKVGKVMKKKYKIGEFSELINIPVKTLQTWDKNGVFKAKRTFTNRRYYTDEDLKKFNEMSGEE
jgi:DNA-binding transcriptional MerR regulator